LGTILPVLALFFGLLFIANPAHSKGQSCLKCHAVHYAEQGNCVDCHRGNPGSDRKNIAHYRLIEGRFAHYTLVKQNVVKEGNRLVDQMACRRCHQLGGSGNVLATSLDKIIDRKMPKEIAVAITSPVTGMPDFRLNEQQAAAVVNSIFSSSSKITGKGAEKPQVIHFDKNSRSGEDAFSSNCGACHRMLTARKGILGSGETGPNLSGLFSKFYPLTFRKESRWTDATLQAWLENPRLHIRDSIMRPVRLDEKQWRELKRIME
jgi:cytochrome c2